MESEKPQQRNASNDKLPDGVSVAPSTARLHSQQQPQQELLVQHSCPYAAALDHHHRHSDPQQASNSNSNSLSDTDDEENSSQDTSKLLQSCPVFQKGSCPFKDCQNEEQVRQALLQIPPSHYHDSTGSPNSVGSKAAFMSVLKELHAVAGQQQQQQKGDKKFQLACPIASKLPAASNSKFHSADAAASFTRVMEGYSLAAIMARMASEMEDEHSDNEEEDSNNTNTDEILNAPPKPTSHKDGQEPAPEEEAKKQSLPRSSAALSESFKTGTAVSHQAAEDVHFVRNFIKGEIDRTLYAELVVQLYHVYEKMEDCLLSSSMQHPALEQFRAMHQQLQRTETLREDLDFWHGPAEAAQIIQGAHTSPAALDYRNRLDYCREQDPLLLLAHSYTRYLGDLSGGKILARVARRALQLPRDGDGLAFYEFAAIPSAKKFKDQFRAALDQLELTDARVQRLVAEANVAFLLNMRLFEELDVMANVPGATVRPLAEALAYHHQPQSLKVSGSIDNDNNGASLGSGECPFVRPSQKSQVSLKGNKEIPAECPFAQTGGGAKSTTTTTNAMQQGRCPWPFILAHDPVAALQDWQTWALIGVVLCWCYSKL